MVKIERERLWTQTYLLLCLAAFLAYAHQALLTPTLPLYLNHLGASPFLIGVTLAVFSVASVLLRPAMGYWADTWSIPGVLLIGALLLGTSALLYLIPSMALICAVNALRGIAWAGLNTGGYTLLAQVAPASRRGEASGYYSSFQSSVSIFFPALALWLIEASHGGFSTVMLLAAAFAFAGAIAGLALVRSTPQAFPTTTARAEQRSFRLGIAAFIDPSVLLASGLLLCIILPQPAMTTFIVLYAREQGVHHLGWYFVASGITSALARPFLGQISDRLGRGISIAAGFGANLLGLFLLIVAPSLLGIAVGGMFYAVGSALVMAATMAVAMERADPARPGRAMATFSTAFQVGAGLGSLVAGGLAEVAGYRSMYVGMVGVIATGLLLTARNWLILNQSGKAQPSAEAGPPQARAGPAVNR